MEFQLPIRIPSLPQPIRYGEKILLTGSCFTEHIGNSLADWKFSVLQNPNGILFDPSSVSGSLLSYIDNKSFEEKELAFFNERWQSWEHHGIFSNTNKGECLRRIDAARTEAHDFLKEAKWLVITLGTAYSYRLAENGKPVANCHRAPAQTFLKHLMGIDEITAALGDCFERLFQFNPLLRVILTISPVRHSRDGVVENNRSKARLIEAVHELTGRWKGGGSGAGGDASVGGDGSEGGGGSARGGDSADRVDRVWYFPAYELVIDVLRDYRFYDIDLVHPNYAATAYVLENFVQYCVDATSGQLLEEVKKIVMARKHKPFQPETEAHKRFLREHWKKTNDLARQFPFLDLNEELRYFSGN
jgi:hypothetical protein